jgi:single-stranded DNA-binding protein
MNSFTVTAIGNLAKNPELVVKGDTAYTRFCLIGNDYAGKDDGGAAREVATSLWFVAFGPLGEAIAKNSRKGDQLFLEARIRANNWTDQQGEKQYDYSFIVVENCGSSLILRCSSSEGGGTARFASTLIGQREIARRTLSRSRRHGEMLGSSTSGEHFSIEPAVLDSEIEQLPDLTGYLKFASQDRWQRVTLQALHRGAAAEAVSAVPAYVPMRRAAELAPDALCAALGDTRKYDATDSTEASPGLRRRSDRMPQAFTTSRSTTVSSKSKTLARESPEQTL